MLAFGIFVRPVPAVRGFRSEIQGYQGSQGRVREQSFRNRFPDERDHGEHRQNRGSKPEYRESPVFPPDSHGIRRRENHEVVEPGEVPVREPMSETGECQREDAGGGECRDEFRQRGFPLMRTPIVTKKGVFANPFR